MQVLWETLFCSAIHVTSCMIHPTGKLMTYKHLVQTHSTIDSTNDISIGIMLIIIIAKSYPSFSLHLHKLVILHHKKCIGILIVSTSGFH